MIGLFGKPVLPGRVKTRLSPPLTHDEAATLYAAFLGDLANLLHQSAPDSWILFSDDVPQQKATWPENTPLPRIAPQEGDDLGTRMVNAMNFLLETGAEAAFLLGSDHPSLLPRHLADAQNLLKEKDVVLGPSRDGGYYLVGWRREAHAKAKSLFDGVTWSTGTVFDRTIENLDPMGLSLGCTEIWYDVDTIDDLQFLKSHLEALRRSESDPNQSPKTWAQLQNLKSRNYL